MELAVIIAVVASALTNLYLVSRLVKLNVTVNVPVPEVLVNVFPPEVKTITKVVPDNLDYGRLEELLRSLIIEQKPLPSVLPPPVWDTTPNHREPPQVPANTNVIDINGIPAKQFPAR